MRTSFISLIVLLISEVGLAQEPKSTTLSSGDTSMLMCKTFKPPDYLSRSDVTLPSGIRLAHSQDTVFVRLTVNTTGIVDSDTVLVSTDSRLDSAALGFGKQYRFSPAEMGGRKVPLFLVLPIAFHQ